MSKIPTPPSRAQDAALDTDRPDTDPLSIQLNLSGREFWLNGDRLTTVRGKVQRSILNYLIKAANEDRAAGRDSELLRYHSIERMCRSLFARGLIQSNNSESLRRSLNRLRQSALVLLQSQDRSSPPRQHSLIESRNNFGYRLHPSVIFTRTPR